MFIGEIFEAATPKRPGIEAHGIKGFKNTPWRKIFKSTEAMLAWAEKYDAEILGTRDLESASQGRLAPAITEDAAELNVGDPVIITGNVQFNGATGDIDSFGQNNSFVVVNLYNHGRHSFHSSDVSFNDYADSDEEEARMYDNGEFPDEFEESATLYDETETNESAGLDRDPSPEAIARNKRLGDIWRRTAGMTPAEYAATVRTDSRTASALSAQADASDPDNAASKAKAAEYKKKFQRVKESHKLPGESDEDYLDRRNAQRKKVGPPGPLIYGGARNSTEVRKDYSDTISNVRTALAKAKPVKEAKSLSKQVRVVKGPHAGSTGWIREIKTGAYKGAPKTYFVDLDNGKQANNLPASALRLVKAPVTEFRDAPTLKPGMLVNHPLVGNARIVWIEGFEVKIEAERDGKFYKVQLSSLKAGPMKMDERDAGISKDAETKFHTKLDKLVHSTFGKRRDEMAEDSGDNEGPTQFFVAMYDGNENTAFVGQLLKRGGQWHERKVAGTAPYYWGSKTYQSYLSVREIMSWIDRDYGDEGNEVEGPFSTAQEAREYAEHQYVPLGESEGTPEGLPRITATMAQNILNQIETEGPSAISKSIEWGDGAAAEMIAMFKADLKKVAAGEKVIDEACWKNYRQIGMKKKNGKQVPNCVPESNYAGRKDVPGFTSGQ